MCEVLRVGLFNGTGAEHDVGGARNTVDVTYFSASTMLSAGMPVAAVATGARDEIRDALLDAVRPGDWVLVKGSRAMGMEAIVRALGAPAPGRGAT